jgi:hypothetical protein
MDDLITKNNSNSIDATLSRDAVKASQEVQTALIIAKKFPRNYFDFEKRIKDACSRPGLAQNAMYAYPKGGQMVTGPSIRLAEVLAQNWGNLDFGIRELSQENGESIVESYCWDMETNVRQTKVFHVPHERYTKKGTTKLSDPREIYEHIANQGARRLRACILGIIPGDVVETAVEYCEGTLKKQNKEPMIDRIKKMVLAFDSLGINEGMIEKRLSHKIDVIVEQEIIALQKIFVSIRDGFSKREDWFEFEKPKSEGLTDLNEKFKVE